ncbi:MAG: hypothetical protein ACOH1N_14930 [Lutibacter sp.]
MAKRIRTETIEIAPNIIGNIQDDGNYFVFDKETNTLLNPENLDDKIKIYERQVKGWFLEPTLKMVKYKPQHKGFLILMSCISYFEGVEQYKVGISSNGNSRRTFINSLNKLYPNKFNEAQIIRLYNQARCGLFHDGMVKGQIIISNTYEESINISHNDIFINPKKLLNDIIEDFENYLALLRIDNDARQKFDLMFSNIN